MIIDIYNEFFGILYYCSINFLIVINERLNYVREVLVVSCKYIL